MSFTFSRLSRLIGQPLMEKTTPMDARRILTFHGATDADMASADAVKAFRRKFMKVNHTDKGGDLAAVQEVNDACDVLQANEFNSWSKSQESPSAGFYDDPRAYSGAQYRRGHTQPEPWAQAGHSGGIPNSSKISRNNYTDLNFIKKTMWELSGKSRKEFTVMLFDGHFFRGVFTVYGSWSIVNEMAKAMLVWDGNLTKRATFVMENLAIFVMEHGAKAMELVWLDGKVIDPAVIFRHSEWSPTGWETNMPYNDQSFMRNLPGYLDDIAIGKGETEYGGD